MLKSLNDIDICAISEHKLFNNNMFFIDSINRDYDSFSRSDDSLNPYDSHRRGKGGVSLLWKRNLQHHATKLNNISNDRIVGIEVFVS